MVFEMTKNKSNALIIDEKSTEAQFRVFSRDRAVKGHQPIHVGVKIFGQVDGFTNNHFLPRKIKIVDQQLVSYSAGPGQVLMNDGAMANARRLGRRVGEAMSLPIEEVKYLGEEEEACPLCHSNLLRLRGEFVECPLCDIKGRIEMKDGRISVVYTDEELERWRWGGSGTRRHHQEIRETHQTYDQNLTEIRERLKKYKAYKSCLVPPPLKTK